MALTGIAGDVASAGAALAGLLLVFMGNASTAFDSYGAEQQGAVRAKYQRRSFHALFGLCISLFSAVLAIIGEAIPSEPVMIFAIAFLGVSAVFVIAAAWQTYGDIS
jgi:hypothetical protein